jgi:2',3'-cyclic-nucleotide 2'-phosphodiesterase (5'-nucleotidase family)
LGSLQVILTSTGTKLENIGCLTIDGDKLDTVLLSAGETAGFIDDIQDKFEDKINEVVAKTDVDLVIHDPKDPEERIIRVTETNLGDLVADAYRNISGADVAIVNGGGIRDDIEKGDITYGEIIAVHPFGNELCVVECTGQDILDALELSVSKLPGENGGFLHVSGLSFTVDMNVESSVKLDKDGLFESVGGDRRVRDVKVGDKDIDPEAIYTLASHNYLIKNGGDGYTMFKDGNLLQDSVMLDNQVLINYIVDELDGTVGEEYSEPYGEGRIDIIEAD